MRLQKPDEQTTSALLPGLLRVDVGGEEGDEGTGELGT